VARTERVELALASLEKSRDAVLLPQRLHPRIAAGEQLVRIALMPHVPHELVSRRIEDGVQRHGQLHDAEARANVAAGPRADVDEASTDLVGERSKLVARERLELRRVRQAI